MPELTVDQAYFLALLIALISPVFQTLKRLAALPIAVKFLNWLSSKKPSWLPGNSNDWQRVALYALATAIARLFEQPILPAFPTSTPTYTLPYATEVLIWVETSAIAIAGFIGLVTVVYHVFYKGLYKKAAEANVPVLKELAPDAIKEAAAASNTSNT